MTHILVIGGGGREHALAWKLAQSPRITRISVAPGNGGTAAIPMATNIKIDATDVVTLLDFAESEGVNLTVVGPEDPIAGGLVDQFEAAGQRIFGPRRQAALIETSKLYAKELMVRYGVPTPRFVAFGELEPAMDYVVTHPVDQIVIKADGLARGKGVFLPRGEDDAEGILRALMLRETLGKAGHTVLLEQRLSGPEVSVMAFTDGRTIAMMPPVCDFKRLYNDNQGPNTGGMGAFAPSPVLTPALRGRIASEIIVPVLRGLEAEGVPLRGVIYTGVILTPDGPQALEINVRFGDPGAQVVLPLLESDLLDVIDMCLDGALYAPAVRWSRAAAAAVVLVTAGYPMRRNPGLQVRQTGSFPEGVRVFHAGTRRTPDDKLVTTGGRVLSLTGVAPELDTAVQRAYAAVTRVYFEGAHYRTDIGMHADSLHVDGGDNG